MCFVITLKWRSAQKSMRVCGELGGAGIEGLYMCVNRWSLLSRAEFVFIYLYYDAVVQLLLEISLHTLFFSH